MKKSFVTLLKTINVMLLAVLVWGKPGMAAEPKIDFNLLYNAALLSDQAYNGKSDIIGTYPGLSAWVATPGSKNVQYVLLKNEKRKNQIIAVRGTVDDTNWDSDMDTRTERDTKAGILMHRGFKNVAEVIYGDLKDRLEPGYNTYLTGHSLGGAVAAILGTYLLDDGYNVAGIYTFGQPKFTNAAGARAYARLPLLRIVYQNDIVVTFPDDAKDGSAVFAHVGPVINLLSGPYYSLGTADDALQFSQGSMRRLLTQVSVPDHKMKWYIAGLREKLDGATRVNFKDRDKYIVRHKAGSGADTTPVKKRQNFNVHP